MWILRRNAYTGEVWAFFICVVRWVHLAKIDRCTKNKGFIVAAYAYNGIKESVIQGWVTKEMENAPWVFKGLWIKPRFKEYLAKQGISFIDLQLLLITGELEVVLVSDVKTQVLCTFAY